jgi:hypothetical protein
MRSRHSHDSIRTRSSAISGPRAATHSTACCVASRRSSRPGHGRPAQRSRESWISRRPPYGDVVGVLVGRHDGLLDNSRDGEWSLRDVLRHAMAVELRYAAQVEYSSTRSNSDPIQIPPSLLPSDRLSPPEPDFVTSRSGGVLELLQLLERARAGSDTRLAKVPDSALTRPSIWGTQPLDVRLRLHQIAAHLTETAIQLEKIIGTGGELRAIIRRCCITRGLHERWSPAGERQILDESYRSLLA